MQISQSVLYLNSFFICFCESTLWIYYEKRCFSNHHPTSRHIKRLLSRWSRPTQVNGVLEFYSIFLSRDGSEPVLVYNSSELLEDHTLRGLTPGRAYAITLAVSDSSRVLSEPHSGLHWCCVPLRPAQGAAARSALPAGLARRRAARRMFPHQWRRLCPHTPST